MVKKVYVIIHSLWGHVKSLADEVVAGLKSEGVDVTLYRVAETLPAEVLEKMYAKTFDEIPVITAEQLPEADGLIFGFGTRYGAAPAQVKALLDSTGGLWAKGALVGKYGAVFTSTATQHGGQETTILTFLTHFAHHGINYVPIGFAAPQVSVLDEVSGGSPWGAGVVTGSQGQRQASANELAIARFQGVHFAKTLNKVQ
ncbi:flavoprotein-like protein [Zopfochytrium polystomum]|nr:flavoprotein-like protein [Zopfochytrium polystomum]